MVSLSNHDTIINAEWKAIILISYNVLMAVIIQGLPMISKNAFMSIKKVSSKDVIPTIKDL